MPICISYSKEEILKVETLENKILIQISGGVGDFPYIDTKNKYHFLFEDCDETEDIIDRKFWISDMQAKQIADIIKLAKEKNMDILVHCNKGVSRSGAVVQAAINYGFKDANKFRDPNLYVLKKIERYLRKP